MDKINILYQDKNWVAVDKPQGLSIHNDEDPSNLQKILIHQYKFKALLPVHRLDKETSGVQIFAFNSEQAQILAHQFQTKSLQKIYHGIARGNINATSIIWKEELSDKAEGRKNPAGQTRDRIPCETRVHVLEKTKFFSYCEFDLITGRQHQIRKHCALAKHALLGDHRYGDGKYNDKIASIYQTDRMFLHCHKIILAQTELISPVPDIFKTIMTAATNINQENTP